MKKTMAEAEQEYAEAVRARDLAIAGGADAARLEELEQAVYDADMAIEKLSCCWQAAPKIVLETKTSNFMFLWLKYVIGFDERHHCAKCLLGRQSKIMMPWPKANRPAGFVREATLDEMECNAYYLCGVSSRGYADNLHVPFEASPGEIVEFEDDNIKVYIEGAARLPIKPVNLPHLGRAYTTCRNFQFGWHRFKAKAAS